MMNHINELNCLGEEREFDANPLQVSHEEFWFKANEEVREETDLVFEKRVTTGNLFDLLKAGKGKASSFTGIQNMLQSKNMYVGGFEAS